MKALGYSLIELIIVIVVLAVAVVGIGSAFAYLSRAQRLGVDLQAATQIAQECAAHVIGSGRKPGVYANVAPVAIPSTICNALPAVPAGYTRVVNVSDMPAGGALCSAGWACKRVEILVSVSGVTLIALNFMLVNY